MATRDSAVRRWPCGNSACSGAWNGLSAPDSGRCSSAVSIRQAAGTSRGPIAAGPVTRASPATQSVPSSKTFHSPASTPPGARTRAISGPAAAMSNQCIAFPETTASTDPSGSGIVSALPWNARTEGRSRRSSASIAASGSTATTSSASPSASPSPSRVPVSFPVPAPRSSTRGPGAAASAHRTAAGA